ncbi:hypothetical protein [Pimelobacter simplex]|uniref:hypothetical protein n=1 Tax=Nocardioides simplex TaxID=2045 RepID=UPI00214F8E52|nr:hypothetical protein [Pimelobacter simplex]UUW88401.1 hypothetical protein M0M43_22015 [Pimelobacter simplex]UUW97905.1 hypothetical protein M0M48_10660 [Pimelobacter simplex]
MPRTTPKSSTPQADPDATDPAAADSTTSGDPGTETGSTPPDPAADTPPAPAPSAASDKDTKAPQPDEHGRHRVRDLDTGHELTIHAAALPHGRYQVLDQLASDELSGQPLPPVHAGTPESPVEPTTSGQEAENKEKLDA